MRKLLATTPEFASMLFALGITAAFSTPLRAAESPVEDWPRFLGPGGNNLPTETNLLDKWPAAGPPLVWEKQVGSGYGAPSVLGKYLVLHHRVKEEEVVEAFDAAKG